MSNDWIGLCLYPEIRFRIAQHFILNPELRQNQTQIAKSLSTAQVSVSRHISALVSLHVLHQEKFGRAVVYSLNSKSALVNRLLKKVVELNKTFVSEWVNERMRKLSAKLTSQVKRIILFGSAVRGELRPSSDIDLLIIVSRVNSEITFELQSLLVAGGAEEGLKINVLIEGTSDFQKTTSKDYVAAAKQEGMPLWPRP